MTLQPGILALGARSHYYLELDLEGSPDALLAAAGSGLDVVRSTVTGVNVVVGFRDSVWQALAGASPGLGDFEAMSGPDGFTMPSTQHDLWVWVSGPATDAVFDAARAVRSAFAGIAEVVDHRAGFTYLDSRDLSGFEDGTENPPVTEAAAVVTIGEASPGAGGSVVLVQQWVHDLDALGTDVAAQEDMIGRTKVSNEELPAATRPETSHISRVVIEEDGEELEIFRRSTPYGDAVDHGLMFIGFSCDRRRLDLMLQRMAGIDGPRDAITSWSTPVSGAYYFVPPVEALVD